MYNALFVCVLILLVSRGTATPARTSPFATLCRRFTPRSAKSELRTFRPHPFALCKTHVVEQTPYEYARQGQSSTI